MTNVADLSLSKNFFRFITYSESSINIITYPDKEEGKENFYFLGRMFFSLPCHFRLAKA